MSLVDDMIERSVAFERARCARIAETQYQKTNKARIEVQAIRQKHGQDIAAAIRYTAGTSTEDGE